MSEDSISIVNVETSYCVPGNKKNPENTFILFNFWVCKFWRGEEKNTDENTLCYVVWYTGHFHWCFFFSHNTAPVVRGEDGRLRHGLVVVMTCVLYLPLWMLSPLSSFFMSSSTRYHHFDLKISFMLHKIR